MENNYLSSADKSLQTALSNKKNLAEEERKKLDALNRKDLESDLAVYLACNDKGGDCQAERVKAKDAQDTYFNQTYQNPKEAQAGYQQIQNLLNSTDPNAKEVFSILEGYTKGFMAMGYTEEQSRARAGVYVGTLYAAGGISSVLASGALVKQFGKDVASAPDKSIGANPKVVAEGSVDGNRFVDTNQGARPPQLADINKPTLINGRIEAKIEKLGKDLPNGNMATAHAEVGVIQQAFEKGMTSGREMSMTVSKEPVCGFCRGDVAAMADKAGLKSLTIFEEKTGKTLYWLPGMKSLKVRD